MTKDEHPSLSAFDKETDESASDKSLSDCVAESLREKIISGDIMPGSSLTEAHLCHQHGASRNTIREALRHLRLEGLVVNMRHKGARVKALTLPDVHDIYKVRHTLELIAVERSAFASEPLFDHITQAIESGEAAIKKNDWKEVGTRSLQFHQAVVALIESERINVFFKAIVAQLRLTFALCEDEKQFQMGWIARDRVIHDYLINGKRQEAADAMQLYLKDSEAMVIDTVRAFYARQPGSTGTF
ncbi:DNA-binding transcriptional regulator, GntR family [Modicisalibacter muralis]|uniref:DNA-binding transcriptional regulator, GntR family n=1 Tax=Modicisalibacter muralis TaxID=119000 RepID=A0A1G9HUR3_9GAMM|nr:GntR family transcriptional regulator [Halomonas muralis]SDL16700.1 DNA-binding transcriptional regulator, GntR family [Halomonas muralis]